MIVGIIDTVISALLATIAAQALGGPVGSGLLVALTVGAMLAAIGYRRLSQLRRDHCPRFPS